MSPAIARHTTIESRDVAHHPVASRIYPPASLADLPVGTVLKLDGIPAVRHDPAGWRYLAAFDGSPQRYLGDNEVDGLDAYPYVAVLP